MTRSFNAGIGSGAILVLGAVMLLTIVEANIVAGTGITLSTTHEFNDTINANVHEDTEIHHESSYTSYMDKLTRQTTLDFYGGIHFITEADTLNTLTNISITTGVSRS